MFAAWHERRHGAVALLVYVYRHLRDLHADALSGHGGSHAAILAVHGNSLTSDLMPLQKFITYAAIVTIAVNSFLIQFVLEHEVRKEGQR